MTYKRIGFCRFFLKIIRELSEALVSRVVHTLGMEKGMDIVEGFVEKIVYQNEDNGYTVLELETDDFVSSCTGYFTGVSEGDYISVQGTVTVHPVYGEQMKMQSFAIKRPTDAASVERYLSSGAIKGIGPAMAKKIIKEFGKDTFRILEEEPHQLSKIKGISENMALDFGKQVREKKDVRDAMMYLQQYGISMNLALKIYDRYKIEMYGILENNPYKLAEDISGIGFKTADEIAKKMGIAGDSDFRIESAIVYAMQLESGAGNVYLPMESLKIKALDILELDRNADISTNISNLAFEKKLIIKKLDDTDIVYLPSYYYMEIKVAGLLNELNVQYDTDEKRMEEKIKAVESAGDITLDDIQKNAVKEAVRNGITVITGGPGTGKTTTINTIIKYFELEGADIRLAAPTGRAAKRMSETTGYEAQTLHRLLEISGAVSEDEDASFGRDESNPIEADVIVVDEMSMVDIFLMKSLVSAVCPGTRLILVGDANQLPSVGPGNVLKDIIESEKFNVVKLNKIFRQAEGSDIVVNAHRINEGEYVDIKKPSKDFLYVNRSQDMIMGAMLTLIKDKLSRYVGVSPYEVQVLTPTRVGAYGSVRLNEILQENLNPPDRKKREKIYGDYVFREGDKVMQIKNDYQIEWEVKSKYGFLAESGTGVFNGDVGIIEEINTFSNEITVSFDYDAGRKKTVVYTAEQLDELELAYAITIHKSQGSEYPAIIIPLANGPRRLMNRNLIYTAVTRAKSCVCMVGVADVFYGMVENDREQERYSTLKTRIKEVCQ